MKYYLYHFNMHLTVNHQQTLPEVVKLFLHVRMVFLKVYAL